LKGISLLTTFLIIVIVTVIVAVIAAYYLGVLAQIAEKSEIINTLEKFRMTVESICESRITESPEMEFNIPGERMGWEITTKSDGEGGNVIYIKIRKGLFNYKVSEHIDLPTTCQNVELKDVDFSCSLPCISSRLCLFSKANFKANVSFDASSEKIKITVTKNLGDYIINTDFGMCY
jgi:hypothetical protein